MIGSTFNKGTECAVLHFSFCGSGLLFTIEVLFLTHDLILCHFLDFWIFGVFSWSPECVHDWQKRNTSGRPADFH